MSAPTRDYYSEMICILRIIHRLRKYPWISAQTVDPSIALSDPWISQNDADPQIAPNNRFLALRGRTGTATTAE